MEEGKSKDFMKMGEKLLNVFLLERSLGVRTYLSNISEMRRKRIYFGNGRSIRTGTKVNKRLSPRFIYCLHDWII